MPRYDFYNKKEDKYFDEFMSYDEKVEYLKTDWSFKGLFGKFDRSALQRGYQVYTEVCSS